MARPKKTVTETVQKEYPDFAQEVDSLSLDALVNEKKAELEGPYKDAKKAISLKIRYLIQRVKDKGGDA